MFPPMFPKVAVVTPTIPGREALLAEAEASVLAQTHTPDFHLTEVDSDRRGPAWVRNHLCLVTDQGRASDWFCFLDDDDLLYPDHISTLLRAQRESGADVVYTHGNITGRGKWNPQRPKFDGALLRKKNYIPVTAMVRASKFRKVGGFPVDGRRYEDHGLWLRLLDADCRFHCEPTITWEYRFGDWDSRSKEIWRGER